MANPTTGMYLDLSEYKTDVFANPLLSEIRCFQVYRDNPEKALSVNNIISYVVVLYSKDSPLSRRPVASLEDRRRRACALADLNPDDPQVQDLVFNLLSEPIRDLIIDYLTWISSHEWTERCVLEMQLLENRKLRFKPIQNKTSAPVKSRKKKEEQEQDPDFDEAQDDNYILTASVKKNSLTDHAEKYLSMIKKYDLVIFADHTDVKEKAVRRHRTTLESLAK